jgi:hypothetical protein
MTIALSFRVRMVIDFSGFGIRQATETDSRSLVCQWFMIFAIGNRKSRGGGVEPSPTMWREVSGKKSHIAARQPPDEMDKNQKIHHHPAANVRAPPRIGPMEGAMVMLKEKQLTQFSR